MLRAMPARATPDPKTGLDQLREAHQLLDGALRTEQWEQAQAASDAVVARSALGSALAGAVTKAVVGAQGSPGATREFEEGLTCLRRAANSLEGHAAADELHDAIGRARGLPLSTAIARLSPVVHHLHRDIRQEFGLLDVPALVDWKTNDDDDQAAIDAAGLGTRSKAIKIAIGVAIVAIPYLWLFSR